jgi:hypothetical protein
MIAERVGRAGGGDGGSDRQCGWHLMSRECDGAAESCLEIRWGFEERR